MPTPTPNPQATQQPIIILQHDTTRETGSAARDANILAAKAIADALRTTLGPKGMDKMLITSVGDVLVTNDGATILKRMDVAHPAAKMLVEAASSQEREAGDGTKTAVILAGELLARAQYLLPDIHATIVTRGYRLAANEATRVLDRLARRVAPEDEATLTALASTSMASKLIASEAPTFASIAIRAARALARAPEHGAAPARIDVSRVKYVQREGGELHDSQLVEGVILERERGRDRMPRIVKDARILLLDDAVKVHKLERTAKITLRDPARLAEFTAEEEREIGAEVDRIRSTGANVVLSQAEIAPEAMGALETVGILAIEKVTKDDMQAIARATGAKSAQTRDATAEDVGRAGLVEERQVGHAKLIFVMECPQARAVSILLRGGSHEVLEETQRTLEDALGVLRDILEDGRALPGAGAPEIEIALALRRLAPTIGGREQLAIEAFADAVEVIPRALAENAGHDAIDALVNLRAAHEHGDANAGLSIATGGPLDAWASGIIEPHRVKAQAIESAAEVANMILRIDEVIAVKGKKV